jgi:hypothetical protein
MRKMPAIAELKEPEDGKELEVERDIFSQVKVYLLSKTSKTIKRSMTLRQV